MTVLLVVDNPRTWDMSIPGAEVVAARSYLTEPTFAAMPRARVFNLCRTYGYQTTGYYVSLLAEARGHRPLPSVATMQDMKLSPILRIAGEELQEQLQRTLRRIRSSTIELSIYFGHNMTSKYDTLCQALFNQFPAPFLRASFRREGTEPDDVHWELDGVRIIGAAEIPDEHVPFVIEQAQRYFDKPMRARSQRGKGYRYDLAILFDERDQIPPSDERAIRKFVKAAEGLGLRTDIITKEDSGRIAEYDALFIRQTTAVNHHTYRLSRRARAEGLVVIDDPDSILRCSNKVYLAELMDQHELPTPKTVIFSPDTAETVLDRIGVPCVIKQPDSSFSMGVKKVDSQAAFATLCESLFEDSELLVAQEFVPTDFDWRIGVLDGEALYACKYYMARQHWQIYDRNPDGSLVEGAGDVLAIDDVPKKVVALAVKSAKLIGDGLYGVDIKVLEGQPKIIEINDNPSIDSGVEDRVLGDALYERIMWHILQKLEDRHR